MERFTVLALVLTTAAIFVPMANAQGAWWHTDTRVNPMTDEVCIDEFVRGSSSGAETSWLHVLKCSTDTNGVLMITTGQNKLRTNLLGQPTTNVLVRYDEGKPHTERFNVTTSANGNSGLMTICTVKEIRFLMGLRKMAIEYYTVDHTVPPVVFDFTNAAEALRDLFK